jgi:hypothetical protein
MARLSFALYQAHCDGVSAESLADRLNLTTEFVRERIEAARLCFLMPALGEDQA